MIAKFFFPRYTAADYIQVAYKKVSSSLSLSYRSLFFLSLSPLLCVSRIAKVLAGRCQAASEDNWNKGRWSATFWNGKVMKLRSLLYYFSGKKKRKICNNFLFLRSDGWRKGWNRVIQDIDKKWPCYIKIKSPHVQFKFSHDSSTVRYRSSIPHAASSSRKKFYFGFTLCAVRQIGGKKGKAHI